MERISFAEAKITYLLELFKVSESDAVTGIFHDTMDIDFANQSIRLNVPLMETNKHIRLSFALIDEIYKVQQLEPMQCETTGEHPPIIKIDDFESRGKQVSFLFPYAGKYCWISALELLVHVDDRNSCAKLRVYQFPGTYNRELVQPLVDRWKQVLDGNVVL